MKDNLSNGYDALATEFMALRSDYGKTVVETWAKSLPRSATALEIGAGHGYPITPVLLEAGLELSAIDASPNMVRAFSQSFPNIRVACEAVEESDFFNEKFDAVLAIGLMFLLTKETQTQLIPKIAEVLNPRGRFLFSAPIQKCQWVDILTGQMSYGLGENSYEAILSQCDLTIIETYTDAGGSHYYDTVRRAG